MSVKKKSVVVLTDYMYDSIQPFWDVFNKAGVDFRPNQCKTSEEIIAAAQDADALLVHFAQITEEVIRALPKCRLIVRSAVGMDCIDIDAAARLGIPTANVPDYGIEDVATHTVLLMLAVNKKLNLLMRTVKEGIWDYAVSKPTHRIQGKTLGLIGCGGIARSTAKKAQAFGVHVIAYDPFLKQEDVEPLGITLVGFDELAAQSDIVSLHLHLNEKTTGMIDLAFFQKMKNDAIFINTARGGLVKEEDLVTALRKKMIAGAGLDVICNEKISKSDPLLQLDNVIITPHAAWYSEEAEHTLLTSAAEEVVRGLNGETLKHPFNGISYAKN